jgi:hypothetical protein
MYRRRPVLLAILLALISVNALAQAPVLTTEILSGYLLAESNYLVTGRPVVQTDIFLPSERGLFADIWDSHQLQQPGRLFGATGDEVDLTGGWNGPIGDYQLRAQVAWWDIASSGNNFGDAKLTLRRRFGNWTPLAGIEDELIIPRRKHIAFVHLGTEVAFTAFRLPVQERITVSWLDVGRVTIANVISTKITLGAIAVSPILRVSTDDRNHGTYATFGFGLQL